MAERRSPGSGDAPSEVEEGRYLYCVVDASGAPDATFSATGVGGAEAHLVEQDGVGVVVHPRSAAHEPTDFDEVKAWLLEHQSVVDRAGDLFGTPLPFRFDTVLAGDDDAVRSWLEREFRALDDALEEVAGKWEYRVELVQDRAAVESRVADEDERLADLRERRRDADEGTAFLLGKQFEQRRGELATRRLDEAADRLAGELRDVGTEVRAVDRQSSLVGTGEADDEHDHRRTFAVLAPVEREEELGARLDEFVAESEAEIRFTGPWPPYSFAPAVGES